MRTVAAVRRELDLVLAQKKLLEAATVEVDPREDGRAKAVRVEFDDDLLRLRSRHDGINALVASAQLARTPTEIVDLYFAKDAVERDFHLIKSEVELRPVRHRTDPKVRAHVVLCVLALLVERALEERMRAGGVNATAPAALEELRTCRLNELTLGATTTHQLTEPNPTQRAILAAIGMTDKIRNRTDWGTVGP